MIACIVDRVGTELGEQVWPVPGSSLARRLGEGGRGGDGERRRAGDRNLRMDRLLSSRTASLSKSRFLLSESLWFSRG